MREVKRLLSRLLLFGLPPLLLLAALFGITIYSGEAMPIGMVIDQQAQANVLYSPQDGGAAFNFKVLSVRQRQPDILALGSSRVMQLRAEVANQQPNTFYNGGLSAATLREVSAFLGYLDPLPPIILLELDQPWFNPDFTPLANRPTRLNLNFGLPNDLSSRVSSLWSSVLRGETPVDALLLRREPLHGDPALGLDAIVQGEGYRSDGSRRMAASFLTAEAITERKERHRQMFADGVVIYLPGDTLAEPTLTALEEILALARDHNALVIGYTPPFAPEFYTALMNSGQHGYFNTLPVRLDALFAQYGHRYFDFTDPAITGAHDEDFWDSWHPSEQANARLYLALAQALPDVLGSYTDTNQLEAALQNVEDTFAVFRR